MPSKHTWERLNGKSYPTHHIVLILPHLITTCPSRWHTVYPSRSPLHMKIQKMCLFVDSPKKCWLLSTIRTLPEIWEKVVTMDKTWFWRHKFFTIKPQFLQTTARTYCYSQYILGIQKSSVPFFVKFYLYLKKNKKILISRIFPVCVNDLLPSSR